jgi:hypothetical protein
MKAVSSPAHDIKQAPCPNPRKAVTFRAFDLPVRHIPAAEAAPCSLLIQVQSTTEGHAN